MAPGAAAADFLTLEFTAGNRRIPNAVFVSLFASLCSPSASASASLRTSQRLRQTLVLRPSTPPSTPRPAPPSAPADSSSARRERSSPTPMSPPASPIRSLLQRMKKTTRLGPRPRWWISGASSTLSGPTSRLPRSSAPPTGSPGSAPTAADHTKRTKLGLLVGESTEPETLAKFMKDRSASDSPVLLKVADKVSNANEADGAGRDDEVPSSNSNETSEVDVGQEGMTGHQNASVKGAEGQDGQEGIAGHQNASVEGAEGHDGREGMVGHQNASVEGAEGHDGQEGMAGHQNASVKGAEGQVSEKSVHASKKRNLMERNPNASTYEWDD